MQRSIHAAFEQVIMPTVVQHFPKANVQVRSLPTAPNHFFIIKYTADGKNSSFGLHVDHTAVTVNIALSDDFDGGGTFMRASSKAAPTEVGRSSQGFCLRPRPGIALVHNGEVAHAGNAITRGCRYVLVAFFHGGEKPAPPLPPPTPPEEGAEGRASTSGLQRTGQLTPELCERETLTNPNPTPTTLALTLTLDLALALTLARVLPTTSFPEDMMLVRSPGHGSSLVDKVLACCAVPRRTSAVATPRTASASSAIPPEERRLLPPSRPRAVPLHAKAQTISY